MAARLKAGHPMNHKPAISRAGPPIVAVAPMMDWTDRHCRFFHRVLTRHALLYTEMVTAQAIRHGDRQRLLGFDPAEQPVALQIGGSDAALLAEAARIGEEFGYAEINLNVGCPSDRVQEGRFGACLMAEPGLVRDCLGAMRDAVGIPVTVKCRIGIDDQDEDEDFERFVMTVAQSGVRRFIVHARKAWLKGLSPRENREVPPLNYARVYALKRNHPELEVVVNGGIVTIAEAKDQLHHVDGVMFGRAAYQTPWLLADVDSTFFGVTPPVTSRAEVVERMSGYVTEAEAHGVSPFHVTRHMLGLFHAQPGGRIWRQILSRPVADPARGADILALALAAVTQQGERLMAAE
jgi:tRNA-dihydrouridine synthase A